VSVAPARAGEWMQALCQNPDGSVAPEQGLVFSFVNASPNNGGWSEENCPGGLDQNSWPFGFGAYVMAYTSTGIPASATATYTAPAGSSIVGGSVTGLTIAQYGTGLEDIDAWISTPADSPDAADAALTCQGPGAPGFIGSTASCEWGASGSRTLNSVPIPDNNGSALYFTAGCSVANTDPCPATGIDAFVFWDWVDVLLGDNTPPTATGFAGSLVAGGQVHGTANLTFTAIDPSGPGIYNVAVQIDGQTVYSGNPSTNGGECDPVGIDPTSGAMMFDDQQPCPTSEQLDVPVDTTQLADGLHDLHVTVEDAAENVATVLDQPFTTQNLTTVASTGSESPATTTTPTSAPAGTGSGSPAPAPAPAPAPVAASVPVVYAFKLSKASAKLSGTVVHRRYLGSKVQLSGTIVDPAGAPAPGVQVTAEVGTVSGTGLAAVASTTTDGAGRFTLLVPRGDSRTVQLDVGQQSVSFTQDVRPNVSLKVVSRKGQRLIFTGRVSINREGGPAPIVEIADRGSSGWQALANVPVDKHGHYHYVFTASPLAIGKAFQIRATTAASTFWQAATSPALTVKVI
jgi:hypothetical protein